MILICSVHLGPLLAARGPFFVSSVVLFAFLFSRFCFLPANSRPRATFWTPLGTSWALLGGLLGSSSGPLEASCEPSGDLLRLLGGLLGVSCTFLGGSWPLMGGSWPLLGGSWSLQEGSRASQEAPKKHFESSWRVQSLQNRLQIELLHAMRKQKGEYVKIAILPRKNQGS